MNHCLLLLTDNTSKLHAQNSADGAKSVERRRETKLQETGGKLGEKCNVWFGFYLLKGRTVLVIRCYN